MVIPPIEDIEDFQKSKFPQLMWFSHFPIQIIQLLGYHGVPPLWNPLPRPIAKGARRPGPPFGSRPAAAVALPLWSGEPRSLGSPRFRCEYSWDLFFQGFSYDRGKTQVFCRVQGKGSDGSGLGSWPAGWLRNSGPHYARNAKMGTIKSQWFRKFPHRHRLHIWSKPFEERTSIKKLGCEKTHNEEQRWRYTTQKHQKFGKVVIWNGINKRWKMGDLASWSYYQPDLGKWRLRTMAAQLQCLYCHRIWYIHRNQQRWGFGK